MELTAKQRTAIYAVGAAIIGLARAFDLINDGQATHFQETLASALANISAILVAVTALVYRPTKTEPALIDATREEVLVASGLIDQAD